MFFPHLQHLEADARPVWWGGGGWAGTCGSSTGRAPSAESVQAGQGLRDARVMAEARMAVLGFLVIKNAYHNSKEHRVLCFFNF